MDKNNLFGEVNNCGGDIDDEKQSQYKENKNWYKC